MSTSRDPGPGAAHDTPPGRHGRPTLRTWSSARNSLRRPATASRTCGRWRGRPTGRFLTSPPTSTRHKPGAEPEEKDQLQEHGVDRPRP